MSEKKLILRTAFCKKCKCWTNKKLVKCPNCMGRFCCWKQNYNIKMKLFVIPTTEWIENEWICPKCNSIISIKDKEMYEAIE